MRLIYGSALILIGSFLEAYYYKFRFGADGIPEWLAWVIGIGLMLLLNALFVNGDYRKRYIALIAGLFAYSVISTSAGQAMSLTEKQVKEIKAVNEYEVDSLEKELAYKTEERDKVAQLITSSVSTFEEVWEWRNTTAKYEQQRDTLNTDIDRIRFRLVTLKNPVIEITEDKNNIYHFYNNLFGASVKWFQFILQTILSAFIAITAPFGIILIKNTGQRERIILMETSIKDWVHFSFYESSQKKSEKIISEKVFLEFKRRRGIVYDLSEYNTIKKLAIKSGVIDNADNIIIKDEQKAVETMWREYGKRSKKVQDIK